MRIRNDREVALLLARHHRLVEPGATIRIPDRDPVPDGFTVVEPARATKTIKHTDTTNLESAAPEAKED